MGIIESVINVKHRLSNIQGVEVSDKSILNPVAQNEINQLEKQLNITLPSKLKEFYQNCSLKLIFSWTAEPGIFGNKSVNGFLNLLSPKEIIEMYKEMQAIVRESQYDEEFYSNEGLRALAADWPHWVPIAIFQNGDAFCINIKAESGEIVFLEHDVMDGGPNLHGLKIANSLDDLFDKWSKVAFVDIFDWMLGVDENGINLSKSVFELVIDKL